MNSLLHDRSALILGVVALVLGPAPSTILAQEDPAPVVTKLTEQRDAKLTQIDSVYVAELIKLHAKYLESGNNKAALAIAAEIKTVDPSAAQKLPTPPEPNADLYAVGDNSFVLAVNGVEVSNGSTGAVSRARVAIQKGDKITVKAADVGGAYGFACAIIRKDKTPIVTDINSWRSYTPADSDNWADPSKITATRRATAATNRDWASKIEVASQANCESIWGVEPSGIAFLYFEVKD